MKQLHKNPPKHDSRISRLKFEVESVYLRCIMLLNALVSNNGNYIYDPLSGPPLLIIFCPHMQQILGHNNNNNNNNKLVDTGLIVLPKLLKVCGTMGS